MLSLKNQRSKILIPSQDFVSKEEPKEACMLLHVRNYQVKRQRELVLNKEINDNLESRDTEILALANSTIEDG